MLRDKRPGFRSISASLRRLDRQKIRNRKRIAMNEVVLKHKVGLNESMTKNATYSPSLLLPVSPPRPGCAKVLGSYRAPRHLRPLKSQARGGLPWRLRPQPSWSLRGLLSRLPRVCDASLSALRLGRALPFLPCRPQRHFHLVLSHETWVVHLTQNQGYQQPSF